MSDEKDSDALDVFAESVPDLLRKLATILEREPARFVQFNQGAAAFVAFEPGIRVQVYRLIIKADSNLS